MVSNPIFCFRFVVLVRVYRGPSPVSSLGYFPLGLPMSDVAVRLSLADEINHAIGPAVVTNP